MTRVKLVLHAIDRFTLTTMNPPAVLIDAPRVRHG
jgi:hypothetical protein